MSEVGSLTSALSHWEAKLELVFAYDGKRSLPVHRKHYGPVRVQKMLWPESGKSAGCCHALIVHPPAGLANGDHLQIEVSVNTGAHVVITTPGSGKWYGSAGGPAQQVLKLKVDDHACLEWLPQDMILFNQAQAQTTLEIQLSDQASFIGWDILTIGRQSRCEQFAQGHYASHVHIYREETLILQDKLCFAGDDRWLRSPLGLGNHTVMGTLWAYAPTPLRSAEQIDDVIEKLRESLPFLYHAIYLSRLDDLMVARVLGQDARWTDQSRRS